MKSILLIAPNEEILKHGKALKKKSFQGVEVCSGLLQEGVLQAQKGSRRGREIFVTRARTAEAIKKAEIPGVVVHISVTSYDLLRAISRAKEIGRKIGIVAFSEMIGSTESFSPLLDVDLILFPYEKAEEVDEAIQAALNEGANVIIGGETTKRAAEKKQIPFIQIITGEEAVAQALEEARRISEIRAIEKTRIQLLEKVIHFSSEAVLIVDEEMKITICNWHFCKISQLSEEEIIGKYLLDVWPELDGKFLSQKQEHQLDVVTRFRGQEVLSNKSIIQIHKKMTGIVFTFQAVEEIRQREAKLRRSMFAREYKADRSFSHVLGHSDEIKKAVLMGKEFALTDLPILLIGEIGVGKHLFAQSIHQYSPRSFGAYVEVNCSSLRGEQFNKEILGVIGSPARPGKPGLFEIAYKGTLFLNEITELDLETQGKLLNILQQKKVIRLGSEKWLPTDVRIIASSSSDLSKAIREGKFRADLYYELSVLQLKIPALNERREDIAFLVKAFLENFESSRKKRLTMDQEALVVLYRYYWRGNIKELFNVLERVAVTCHDRVITKRFLQEILGEDLRPNTFPVHEMIRQDQIDLIRHALKESKGNYGLAAKKLGVDRSTLWRRLKRLGLK